MPAAIVPAYRLAVLVDSMCYVLKAACISRRTIALGKDSANADGLYSVTPTYLLLVVDSTHSSRPNAHVVRLTGYRSVSCLSPLAPFVSQLAVSLCFFIFLDASRYYSEASRGVLMV